MENILGLEIIEDKIRILEMCNSERGWEPLLLDQINLPPDSIKEGQIIEPKIIADRISGFIKERKISAKKAAVLFSLPYVCARLIRLPFNLSNSQIRVNLEAEVNQYQTFAGKDNIIDFRKIEEISEEGIKKVNVLFITTFRALTESYLKTLDLAGLELIDVEVPVFSTMRLLDEVDFKSLSLEVNLLMLIESRYLEICIIKGNRPRFLHSVEIDMYDFDKDRQNFIDRIVSAIKLVVNFYQVRFIQGEKINRIIIHPFDSKYNSIHPLLQEKLPHIPICLSNPLSRVFPDKEKAPDLDKLRFSFSGLLGAILKIEEKNRPFNLNLLLEQKIHRRRRLNQMYLLITALGILLIVLIISLGWVIFKINILQRRSAKIVTTLEQPTPELKEALSIKERMDTLAGQFDEANLIMQEIKKSFYFKNIAKAMVLVPKDLWLTKISLEKKDNCLFLTGQSRTEKSIFEYISNLNRSGYFGSVELDSSKNEIDSIQFIIRCAIK